MQEGRGLAHLKDGLGRLFVERELLIEDGTPTSVVFGRGLVRLIAKRDPSTDSA
jgi:hypothetical protein